jgi:hypothetical protein
MPMGTDTPAALRSQRSVFERGRLHVFGEGRAHVFDGTLQTLAAATHVLSTLAHVSWAKLQTLSVAMHWLLSTQRSLPLHLVVVSQ